MTATTSDSLALQIVALVRRYRQQHPDKSDRAVRMAVKKAWQQVHGWQKTAAEEKAWQADVNGPDFYPDSVVDVEAAR